MEQVQVEHASPHVETRVVRHVVAPLSAKHARQDLFLVELDVSVTLINIMIKVQFLA
jgi:hypothetical protein